MFDKTKLQNIVFWLIPIFILLVQFIFTTASTSQIRYEELAESVRNVFWLQNKTIYDGISSNVGWYGTLLLIYNFFGFTLNTAKFFRLILAVVSIFCLAKLLRKYLGKNAWLPLLVVGLSPVFLYFNTFQTSFGIDLQYLLICLFLLEKIDFHGLKTDKHRYLWNLLLQVGLWGLMMVAWMSYPTFVFYVPGLTILYLKKLKSEIRISKSETNSNDQNTNAKNSIFRTKNLLISIVAFLSPFLIALIYLKDKSLFLFDPTTRAGIFRGSGSMEFDWKIFSKNLTSALSDIFSKGNSYNFELASPDFANYYPVVAVLFLLGMGVFVLFRSLSLRGVRQLADDEAISEIAMPRQARLAMTKLVLLLSFFTLIFSLVFSNLALDPTGMPGIRRNTAMLASFYAIFTICWYLFNNPKAWSSLFPKCHSGERSDSRILFGMDRDPGQDGYQMVTRQARMTKQGNNRLFQCLFLVVFLLIPIHHLLSIPQNLESIKNPSRFQYAFWAGIADTPSNSLKVLLNNALQKDFPLSCKQEGRDVFCRYSETYAALAGSCLWNKLSCKNISGFDPKTKRFIPLSTNLWETNYFEH